VRPRRLIFSAYTASSINGLRNKVYWSALEPRPGGIWRRTLDRHRAGHYVWTWDVGSYWWLTAPASRSV